MAAYVAFLQGINVGKRTVRKEAFVAAFEALGYDDVGTFIASGNVRFATTDKRSGLEEAIEAALRDALGFEVTTFVRTAAEVRALAGASPFPPDVGGTVLVGFLKRAPRPKVELRTDRDDVRTIGTELWWLIDGKVMDSLLKPRDWKQAGVTAITTRNVTTIEKLAAKLA